MQCFLTEMNVHDLSGYFSRERLYNRRTSRLNQLNSEQPSVSIRKQQGDVRGLGQVRGPLGKVRGLGNVWGPLSKAVRRVCRFFYLFMEMSSIHGFNHLTTRKRHALEQ